jgi:hypothetical protein
VEPAGDEAAQVAAAAERRQRGEGQGVALPPSW